MFGVDVMVDPDIESVGLIFQRQQGPIVPRSRTRIEVWQRVVLVEKFLGNRIQLRRGNLIVGEWHTGDRIYHLTREGVQVAPSHRGSGYVIDD